MGSCPFWHRIFAKSCKKALIFLDVQEKFHRKSVKPSQHQPESQSHNKPSPVTALGFAEMKVGFKASILSAFAEEQDDQFSANYKAQFSNLFGTVYSQGNLVFTPDGFSLLSPVGNRVTCFDLLKYASRGFPEI